MVDTRRRERKLEEQRHELKHALNEAQHSIRNLTGRVNGADKRIAELQLIVEKGEGDKVETESKLTSVANILNQVCTATSYSR